MKPPILLLIFAISFSLHCNSTTSDGGLVPEPPPVVPPDLTKIIPLAVGNSWEYRDIRCGGWGCDTTYSSVNVTDTVILGGRKHFVMDGDPAHLFKWGSTYLETVDSTSYAMYWCIGCLDGEGGGGQWLPLMVLRTPLSRGHQWRIADWDTISSFFNFGNLEITSVDSTVVVAGRRFERAIAVAQHTGHQFEDLRFVLVPEVGVVSQSSGGLDTWFRRELVEWNVE